MRLAIKPLSHSAASECTAAPLTSPFLPASHEQGRMEVSFTRMLYALCLVAMAYAFTQEGFKEVMLKQLGLSEVPKLHKRDLVDLVIPEHVKNKYISMLKRHRGKRRASPSLASILQGIPGNAGNTRGRASHGEWGWGQALRGSRVEKILVLHDPGKGRVLEKPRYPAHSILGSKGKHLVIAVHAISWYQARRWHKAMHALWCLLYLG